MNRRTLFGMCRGALAASILTLAGIPSVASASESIPAELVVDGEPIEFEDPYCPTCHNDPPPLVAETPMEATLSMRCDRLTDDGSDGVVFVEVELDDGRTVRLLREDRDALCSGDDDVIETTLYAGPDWTWDSVSLARVAVIQG